MSISQDGPRVGGPQPGAEAGRWGGLDQNSPSPAVLDGTTLPITPPGIDERPGQSSSIEDSPLDHDPVRRNILRVALFGGLTVAVGAGGLAALRAVTGGRESGEQDDGADEPDGGVGEPDGGGGDRPLDPDQVFALDSLGAGNALLGVDTVRDALQASIGGGDVKAVQSMGSSRGVAADRNRGWVSAIFVPENTRMIDSTTAAYSDRAVSVEMVERGYEGNVLSGFNGPTLIDGRNVYFDSVRGNGGVVVVGDDGLTVNVRLPRFNLPKGNTKPHPGNLAIALAISGAFKP